MTAARGSENKTGAASAVALACPAIDRAQADKIKIGELVATDVTDFSPYLLKVRQARPDVLCCNLGNQVTNLIKQDAEFGLPYPVVGFNLNTADAWAAGDGNLSGTWPTVWHDDLDTPGSKKFVADFTAKHKKPPENHAWIEYVSLKMMAFQITSRFRGLTINENLRLSLQARHPGRFNVWRDIDSYAQVQAETAELVKFLGLEGIESSEGGELSYGGRLVDLGIALGSKPQVLLLDEPPLRRKSDESVAVP